MNGFRNRFAILALQNAPLLLFAALIVVFGLMSDRFLTPVNFLNIINQSSHIAIIAIGMTFVLLIAGIDLSVGANMYLSAAILGVFLAGMPPAVAFPVVAVLGLAFGAFNGFMITQLRVAAFIATLSTLFIGRGIALYFSGNKMVPFSKSVLTFGRTAYLGIPSAIWVFALVLIIALVVLKLTAFGRQVYAIGADPEGIPGDRRGGAGRHQSLRRARRRAGNGVRRGADPDCRERSRDDQRQPLYLSPRHQRHHLHRRLHRQLQDDRSRKARAAEDQG
jgi:ribose/xylose/arabinose/galactoside ABC-type transport system permease subunit